MAEAAVKLDTDSNDLVTLKSTPAKLELNIQELRDKVAKYLEPFDVVVTADNVKDTKALMTKLNNEAALIKETMKDISSKLVEPVTKAEQEVGEIVDMILDARQNLKTQVDNIESELKAEIAKQLKAKQIELWDELGVNDEFRKSDVSKLAKLTSVTAKGAITAATLKKISEAVSADKDLQTKTEMRLLTLETESYKAGLKAPLSRVHVESFLFESDDVYQGHLAAMLDNEVKRQEATVEAFAGKLSSEAKPQESKSSTDNFQDEANQARIQALEKELQSNQTSMRFLEGTERLNMLLESVELDAEIKRLKAGIEVEPEETYILCSIHDTANLVAPPMKTSKVSEVYQAALSESYNLSESEKPFYVAVWSQTAGRVAIVDGLSMEIFPLLQA